MTLKTHTVRPPTGWVYVQPETGYSANANTRQNLINDVLSHRVGNNLDRANPAQVWADIQAHICGLLRGKRALWVYCNTKMPFPFTQGSTAPMQMIGRLPKTQEAIPVKVSATPTVQAVEAPEAKPKKSCPTCGLKRKKSE